MIMSSIPIGDAGLEGGLEAELLELVEGLDGDLAWPADLVGVENQVTELALRNGEVDEAEPGGPDLAEDHAADGGAEELASPCCRRRCRARNRDSGNR